MNHREGERPFGWRDKIGYLLGNLGNDFTFTFASIFLLVFYTKVLEIPSALVGTMFLLARFVDAFTDITMGRIADKRKPSSGGKFRPWLLWMSGPVALASFLMYQSALSDAAMWLRIVYMFATYLLWGSVFYTAVNIPFGSMASVISADPDHRVSLSTFRSIGSVVANLVVGVGAPALIYTADEAGNQLVRSEMFPRVAAILSVLSVVCYLACYGLVTERVCSLDRKRAVRVPFGETVRALVTNRALIGIVLASVGVLAAQLLNQTINQYLFIDYFRDKNGIMIMSVVSMLPGLLLAPVAVSVSRRFGKKEVGVFGSLCGAASCFLLFLLRTRSMWVYILVNFFGFLGFGVFNLIMWAYITDIIDDQEVKTGRREDGTVYAVYSFARKVGQALAGGLGGWTLGWIGFDESAQVQSAAVTEGIYGIATLLPAVLYALVAVSLAFVYPLGRKRVEANIVALKERKQKEADR